MTRQKFPTRKTLLRSRAQVDSLLALVPNLPLDDENPLEVVIREQVKTRKLDQNALMWVGLLANIAEQAWFQGRQFSAELWHEMFKVMYLPEDDDPEIHLLAKEGYRKWDYLPNGDRVCVGSTTELLVMGFSRYLEQVQAHGASMGVIFHANPRERQVA